MENEISQFFFEITRNAMLPYQLRYAQCPFEPTLVQIPTGLGKTLTVLVPWLHAISSTTAAPTRLIFVLPRQNLTEQTSRTARGLVTAARLESKVRVLELMGGSEENNDRSLGPDEPAIIISTQDLYLSRALNRGYARRPPRWPMDFALFNNDCLIVFDEIQLMSDGLASSAQLAAFREQFGVFGQVPCIWMSATLDPRWLDTVDFAATRPRLRKVELEADDLESEVVRRRLNAVKRLAPAPETCRSPEGCAQFALEHHRPVERTLVIANTVQRAKEIFAGLRYHPGAILLHSRFRPPDRRARVNRLDAIPVEGQIVVSTQVLEAGIDISADRLITDIAPWSSLVQRFGRVNRRGEGDGEVWWVDKPMSSKRARTPDQLFAPYQIVDIKLAAKKLGGLHSASPAALPPEHGGAPWQHVLRKVDLLDLFDTSADLSGNHIDVSRFIRSGEEKDCYIAWRAGEPGEQNEADDAELCPVTIGEAREFAKKHDFHRWDFAEQAWRKLETDRLFPGMILLARSDQGGYTEAEGWSPASKQPVPALPTSEFGPEGDGGDPFSVGYRQTLIDHTDDVRRELVRMLDRVAISDVEKYRHVLVRAALLHDWGKAHPVMQETLGNASTDLLAKQEREKAKSKHSRKNFRHELASALAMLAADEPDLAAYLVAAHHGRIRVSIRSMQGDVSENEDRRVRGIDHGELLPACEIATGIRVPAVSLSLTPMQTGATAECGISWTERAIRLRDEIGPFRLAFLEMLLRAADERASRLAAEAACIA